MGSIQRGFITPRTDIASLFLVFFYINNRYILPHRMSLNELHHELIYLWCFIIYKQYLKGEIQLKRFSFLLLGLVLSIALVACDEEGTSSDPSNDNSPNQAENNNEVDNNTEEPENEPEEPEESGNLGIGDTAEFDEAKFTLKDVTTTDERNEFADTDPDNVIAIEYELENISDEDIPYGAELTVYDAEGNQMDSYPLDSDMGSLAPGKKVQGVEHHGVDALGTIEIHFAPLISFEDAAVFEVDIE